MNVEAARPTNIKEGIKKSIAVERHILQNNGRVVGVGLDVAAGEEEGVEVAQDTIRRQEEYRRASRASLSNPGMCNESILNDIANLYAMGVIAIEIGDRILDVGGDPNSVQRLSYKFSAKRRERSSVVKEYCT